MMKNPFLEEPEAEVSNVSRVTGLFGGVQVQDPRSIASVDTTNSSEVTVLLSKIAALEDELKIVKSHNEYANQVAIRANNACTEAKRVLDAEQKVITEVLIALCYQNGGKVSISPNTIAMIGDFGLQLIKSKGFVHYRIHAKQAEPAANDEPPRVH